MLKLGQTYICTYTDKWWWTEGKEYRVSFDVDKNVVLTDDKNLVLIDDEGDTWSSEILTKYNVKFKLKEMLDC